MRASGRAMGRLRPSEAAARDQGSVRRMAPRALPPASRARAEPRKTDTGRETQSKRVRLPDAWDRSLRRPVATTFRDRVPASGAQRRESSAGHGSVQCAVTSGGSAVSLFLTPRRAPSHYPPSDRRRTWANSLSVQTITPLRRTSSSWRAWTGAARFGSRTSRRTFMTPAFGMSRIFAAV